MGQTAQFFVPFDINIMNNMNNINNNNFASNNMGNQVFSFNNSNMSLNNDVNNNNNNKKNSDFLEGSDISIIKSDIQLKYPHLIGLVNLGQTCYMNSTLQCLSNIPELSDYLLNNYYTLNSSSNPLSMAYTNLLFKLFLNEEQKTFTDPTEFKNIIGDLNPLFQGFQAADSKDLLFFLIETLHNELNKTYQNSNPIKDFNRLEQEAREENKMLQNFFEEFKCANNSIISKNFYGIQRSKMNCQECNITKYSFQTFNMEIFQLKKLKEDKKANLGRHYNTLTLMEAFIFSEKEDILEGENMIYCNNCRRLTKGKNKQDFYRLPRILIIVLNRGKNNADFNEEFDFPDNLDFTGQNIILDQKSCMKYYLMSIITHLGESGSNGHFIAYVRDGRTDRFFCYNDASVSKVTINEAKRQKISKREEEKITPYILFYHCDE